MEKKEPKPTQAECAYCESDLPTEGSIPGPIPRLKSQKQAFFCDPDCGSLWERQQKESTARHPHRSWRGRAHAEYHGDSMDGRAPNDRPEKDWDPNTRILKTLALDNHGYEYHVALEKKATKWNPVAEWVLAIGHTPGRWNMSTLMESGLLHNEIYIDFGQGWKIINFNDVLSEAITLI